MRARDLALQQCLPFPALKDSLARAEDFVQRFLKVIGRAREIGADLRDVLLIALLYLVAK